MGGGGGTNVYNFDVQVLFLVLRGSSLAINILIGVQPKLLTVSFLTSHFIAATSQCPKLHQWVIGLFI